MTSYAVRLDVPLTARAGERTAAIVGRLDDRLAGWSGKAVRDAQLESQLGRGGRVRKVRVTMTVQAADAAKALVLALGVLRQAIGADARSWDVSSAAATIAPTGTAAPAPLARPNLVWRNPLLHRAAILGGAASLRVAGLAGRRLTEPAICADFGWVSVKIMAAQIRTFCAYARCRAGPASPVGSSLSDALGEALEGAGGEPGPMP